MPELLLLTGFSWLLVIMMPGANFVMVVKNTLSGTGRAGVFTAFGATVALLVHILSSLAGLGAVLARSAFLLNTIALTGSVYLIWCGFKAFRPVAVVCHKTGNITNRGEVNNTRAFKQGFFISLYNPKSILFVIALFGAVIKNPLTLTDGLAVTTEMILMHFIWLALIVWLFIHPPFRGYIARAIPWITRGSGLILVLIGAGLGAEALFTDHLMAASAA